MAEKKKSNPRKVKTRGITVKENTAMEEKEVELEKMLTNILLTSLGEVQKRYSTTGTLPSLNPVDDKKNHPKFIEAVLQYCRYKEALTWIVQDCSGGFND